MVARRDSSGRHCSYLQYINVSSLIYNLLLKLEAEELRDVLPILSVLQPYDSQYLWRNIPVHSQIFPFTTVHAEKNCDFIIATCKKCEKIQSIFYFPFYYFSSVIHLLRIDGDEQRKCCKYKKCFHLDMFECYLLLTAISQNCCSLNRFECKSK